MLQNNDRENVVNLKRNDLSAFDALFKKYSESLYAFALSLTKEPYIAEEITQLVFIKIWEKRAKIEEHLSFKSFLFTIAYTETISWLRKENAEKRKINMIGNKVFELASNETNFLIEFNNIQSMANEIIDSLPEKRREIFKLSREQGFTNKEIATRLNISVKTVENQITSALKTLKELLGKDEILGLLFYFVMFH